MSEEYLTVSEAADKIGVKRARLVAGIAGGHVPGRIHKGQVLVRMSKAREALERCEAGLPIRTKGTGVTPSGRHR